jgi:hypothetical protein
MDIGEYLKEGSEVVDGSLGDATVARANCIKIDRLYYETVSTDRELNLALEKRFKGKNTLYITPNYATLVWLCLSTDGYKVSSANLNNVSDNDVSEAWQFIDTTSISSTKRCREMISLGKNNRSDTGFTRYSNTATRQKIKARVNRNRAAPTCIPTLLSAPRECGTEHDTIEDAMLEDCMRWVLDAGDPVKSATALRSNVLCNAKGV